MKSIDLDPVFFDFDAFLTDHDKLPEIIIFKINLEYLAIRPTKLIAIQLSFKYLIKIPNNDIFAKS